MFSSLGLFKEIACPEQAHCHLPNCIFAHYRLKDTSAELNKPSLSPALHEKNDDYQRSERPSKKRRLATDYGETPPKSISAGNLFESLPETTRRAVASSAKQISKASPKSNAASQSSQKPTEVSLNPRMLLKPPATHAVRMQLISVLHEYISRLNEEVKQSDHPSRANLQLSPQSLIAQALSEEEKVATEKPAVYLNVIKLRILKLKKMRLAEWIEERLKQAAKPAAANESEGPQTVPNVLETGLTPGEEIAFLPRLFADQSNLAKFGYVTAPVNEADIKEARHGVAAALQWEQCDRCKTRFQVFRGRREEDGALTSGGQCLHHPGKPRRPMVQDKQDRADRAAKEQFYTCCNEAISASAGCTTAATHVFKVSEPKRLALIMPFETTPPNPSSSNDPKAAVCFDCEMGYTTVGLELIRLTATSWPSGASLLDILVRPLGEILDLNSRYSGVWPKDFASALPYDDDEKASSTTPPPTASTTKDSSSTINNNNTNNTNNTSLRIVSSPAIARSLLFTHLTPSTPLIGHALDNDLNSVRIIHPSLVDTVLLYPHPRGLPLRFGLKALMKKYFDRDIQTGGGDGEVGVDKGHDSAEDARAAGDLVRLRVKEAWGRLRREGWSVRDEVFLAPAPPGLRK